MTILIQPTQTDRLRPITDVAADLGLAGEEIELYGRSKAKISLDALDRRAHRRDGRLVLVTAISPTPAGEGKTTLAIGLSEGLNRIGSRCVATLREPSMGPVFGRKGGGTGGGLAQVQPASDINLHFTGDLHAIAAANNLLAAVIDNALQWGDEPRLDPRRVTWKRCLDVNDRALRDVVIGLGGAKEGVPRETGFDITAASEVMAILALAESAEDLTSRLARIVVGSTAAGEPVTAGQLKVSGAMAALLSEALKPNLVQTSEGTPAILHAGPFGNIAHGCSSVLATRLALKLGEVCVTEAGFGADLGAEKFCDIKMRQSGLSPDAAVLVATIRALKMHGGVPLEALETGNLSAIAAGFVNLRRHAENLRKFGLPVVVAINRFPADTEAELEALADLCAAEGLPVAVAGVFGAGGAGAADLARLLLETLDATGSFRMLYPDEMPLREKIETVAREIYRAGRVEFLPAAAGRLAELERLGFGRLPVCMAKTQYSFSDDPANLGAPAGHTLTVREARLSAGAGFVVALTGAIMTMPGLPRRPTAEQIALAPDGTITGLR
jgi:formate--tetrahydrofolate ligase